MPAFKTVERIATGGERPEETHVPAQVLAHRLQDSRGGCPQRCRFQDLCHGEPDISVLLDSLRWLMSRR